MIVTRRIDIKLPEKRLLAPPQHAIKAVKENRRLMVSSMTFLGKAANVIFHNCHQHSLWEILEPFSQLLSAKGASPMTIIGEVIEKAVVIFKVFQ